MKSLAFLILFLFAAQSVSVYAGSFHKDVKIHWGDGRAKIHDNEGKLLSLSLDKSSGSGFQSNQEFLYGKAEVQMKLVPDNSAGTVTTFYLKSPGTTWDEIDFGLVCLAERQVSGKTAKPNLTLTKRRPVLVEVPEEKKKLT